MTTPIQEKLTTIHTLLSTELENVVQVPEDIVKQIARLINAPDGIIGAMFCDQSNLVITEAIDYNVFRLISDLELNYKIELTDYNEYLYIFKYHNCDAISAVLGRIIPDNTKGDL